MIHPFDDSHSKYFEFWVCGIELQHQLVSHYNTVKAENIANDWTNTLKSGDIWQWRFQQYGVTISIKTLTFTLSYHGSLLTTKRNPVKEPIPIRKWRGFSSCFLTTFPLKNLLPKRSGVMKVPYLAIPISYGLNSTQSVS